MWGVVECAVVDCEGRGGGCSVEEVYLVVCSLMYSLLQHLLQSYMYCNGYLGPTVHSTCSPLSLTPTPLPSPPPTPPQIPANGRWGADLCPCCSVQPGPSATPLSGEPADSRPGARGVQPLLHVQRVLQAAGKTAESCHQLQHPTLRHVGHLGQGTAVDTRSEGVCMGGVGWGGVG